LAGDGATTVITRSPSARKRPQLAILFFSLARDAKADFQGTQWFRR